MSASIAGARRSLADAGKLAGGRLAQGLNIMLGSRSHDRFGILYYHRICRPPKHLPRPPLNVDPETFRRQLEGLRRRGFGFMTVGELMDTIERGSSPPPRTVAVTFDDGFDGVWRFARPVLRDLGIRGTLFVASAFIGSDEPFPFDPWGQTYASSSEQGAWKPLTWERCAEMVDTGELEIGTHTHTHADFRGRPQDLFRDIRTSVETIQERTGLATTLLSFPYGNVRTGFAGAELAAAARDAGMRCGLTTTIDLVRAGDDPFRWGRFEASDGDTPATLTAKLGGWYSWMEHGRRILRSVM
jgi:peptidoglycan/xylan/chitin deacetylase (PgdA/CDA1 family)